jgi:hypothetical protein
MFLTGELCLCKGKSLTCRLCVCVYEANFVTSRDVTKSSGWRRRRDKITDGINVTGPDDYETLQWRWLCSALDDPTQYHTPSYLLFRDIDQIFVLISHFHKVCYMPHKSCTSCYNNVNNIRRRVQSMKLFFTSHLFGPTTMQFFPWSKKPSFTPI